MTDTNRRKFTTLSLGLASAAVVGCSTPQVADYAAETPKLDLKSYFNGTVDAVGIFTDRSGKVIKRFTVRMECSWTGAKGVLDEYFSYSDGTKERRVWRLTDQGDGRYTGTADDVIGEATGQASGNAFRWNYVLALAVDGRVWHVSFDDWMYLMSDQVMMNVATMSKWGVELGRVTLSFIKR
ncbi:MAG: hypothetical protein RLY82_739 [Pseudomonadota bacterium]